MAVDHPAPARSSQPGQPARPGQPAQTRALPPPDPASLSWHTSLAGLAGLHAGQPVTVEFVRPPDGESYPLFRPVGNDG